MVTGGRQLAKLFGAGAIGLSLSACGDGPMQQPGTCVNVFGITVLGQGVFARSPDMTCITMVIALEMIKSNDPYMQAAGLKVAMTLNPKFKEGVDQTVRDALENNKVICSVKSVERANGRWVAVIGGDDCVRTPGGDKVSMHYGISPNFKLTGPAFNFNFA